MDGTRDLFKKEKSYLLQAVVQLVLLEPSPGYS